MADYSSSSNGSNSAAAPPRKSSEEVASSDLRSRSRQRRASMQQQQQIRSKGRRPSQYTDKYTPPSQFSKFKAQRRSSSLDRSEDDGDHSRKHLKQGNSASPGGNSSAEAQQNQTTSSPQRHGSDERRNNNHRSYAAQEQRRKQSYSSPSKGEPTEQQIAEYAGKRALMRLEQEFADSSAHNNYSNHSIDSIRSVMDRRKLARVPQVRKRDLIIGEYLGRGNFCDVFEVTWILEDNNRSSLRSSARAFSQSVNARTLAESDYSVEDLESSLDSIALTTSNDLSLLSDDRRGAPRTRRSVSQVRVLQNRLPTGGSFRRDPNVLALKCLRPAVRAQPRKFVIGAEDLAHETALLACLDHPNIITLYGRAEGCFSTAFQMRPKSGDDYDSSQEGEGKKVSNEGYFIILDRLMATLTGRIDEWMEECQLINGARVISADLSPKKEPVNMPSETNLREHLYKRLKVAYCIADALEYLHSRHVVFRDLKPANVGFDCNDCVKMFDFGFATSIAPLLNQEYQGYGPLTETCGTRRYMAPEVALKLGYGKEVDVYSFGMLLWEICVLEKPFDSIQSVEEFHDLVVLCGKRPSLHIDPLWTPSLKHLMSKCWSTDPLDRPTMMEVKSLLCNVLRDMNVKAMESRGGNSGNGSGQSQQQNNFMNKWRRRVSI